ncbi:MAG: Crp/Fnr family transcriptional regulator [Clostridia bacterium]|nr:Crp/Fnr family transcriptional regulator [Clostridia bacterium]
MIYDLFLLNNLSDNEKEQIISLLDKPFFFKKGKVIYSRNNFKKALGYIVSGKASAVNDSLFKKSFEKGNVFGAAAVFGSDNCYVSKIVAESDCEVLFISEETLKKIFNLYPVTTVNYIMFLSNKIRFLNLKLNMISCTNAEDTVYKYLIENMNSEKIVNLPVSMTTLARMLNIGRATLYRSFDSLEYSGKIKRKKNNIKVI